MKHLLLILSLITTQVNADTFATITLASKHLNSTDRNEKNLGLGINHNGYLLGFYKNSFKNNTTYIGKEFVTDEATLQWGLQVGLIKGYADEEIGVESLFHDYHPLFIPEMLINTTDHTRIKIGLIPNVSNPTMTLQVELRI